MSNSRDDTKPNLTTKDAVAMLYDLIDRHQLQLAEAFEYASDRIEQQQVNQPSVFTGQAGEKTEEEDPLLVVFNNLRAVLYGDQPIDDTTENREFAQTAIHNTLKSIVEEVELDAQVEQNITKINEIIEKILDDPEEINTIYVSGHNEKRVINSLREHFRDANKPIKQSNVSSNTEITPRKSLFDTEQTPTNRASMPRGGNLLESVYPQLLQRISQDKTFETLENKSKILSDLGRYIANKENSKNKNQDHNGKLIQYIQKQSDQSQDVVLFIKHIIQNTHDHFSVLDQQQENTIESSPIADKKPIEQPTKTESISSAITKKKEEKIHLPAEESPKKNIQITINKKVEPPKDKSSSRKDSTEIEEHDRAAQPPQQVTPRFFSLASQLPAEISPHIENDDVELPEQKGIENTLIQFFKNADTLPIGHIGLVESLGENSLAADMEDASSAQTQPETKLAPQESQTLALMQRMHNYAMQYVSRDDHPKESAEEYIKNPTPNAAILFLKRISTSHLTNKDEKSFAETILSALKKSGKDNKSLLKKSEKFAVEISKKHNPTLSAEQKKQDALARSFIYKITTINLASPIAEKALEKFFNNFTTDLNIEFKKERLFENLPSTKIDKMKHTATMIVSNLHKIYSDAYNKKLPDEIDEAIASTQKALAILNQKNPAADKSTEEMLCNILTTLGKQCGLEIKVVTDGDYLKIKPSPLEDTRLKTLSAVMSYKQHIGKIPSGDSEKNRLLATINLALENFMQNIVELDLADPTQAKILTNNINALKTKSLEWDTDLNKKTTTRTPPKQTLFGKSNQRSDTAETERKKAIQKVFNSLKSAR